MGQHIAAIDTLADATSGVAKLLWMRELGETLPGVPVQTGVQVRQMELPWGQRRNLISDAFGRNVGWLGPITANYFCVQRGRDLSALDPSDRRSRLGPPRRRARERDVRRRRTCSSSSHRTKPKPSSCAAWTAPNRASDWFLPPIIASPPLGAISWLGKPATCASRST